MNFIMRSNFAAICLSLFCLLARPASADTSINLLKLPSATLEITSLVGDQVDRASPLTDGKRDTVASIDAGGADTVDLVFGFAGETVAPEAIVVELSKKPRDTPPARVEILASTVSPQTGFKSLRADPIKQSTPVQTFAFPPAAARWIMVRLTLSRKATPVSLAEIEILGRSGEPITNYAFRETPARVIDILSRLEKANAVSLAVSDEEKRLFQKAKGGRLDPADFSDAALLASGVLDAAKRKQYHERIEDIARKAQLAVASGRDPMERGQLLLRWLHREVLKKGYRASQTSLSVLLDQQTFNCVSSAVLYNIVALKLGMDARAIEVPDHAFSIVYQGTTHVDVETTNALGFNPSRDQIKNFEKLTGFRYVPEKHRDQRRELTEAGLAALIYYNNGVEFSRAKRHYDALLAYFRAMSLDSEFASAAKNALASLTNWSHELATRRQWQQAADVITIGVNLAPNDAALTSNQVAIWGNWAASLIDAGQSDEAIAVLKQAAKAVPKGGFETMQAWAYIKPSEALIKARKWQAAVLAAEGGLPKLDPIPRQELVRWRNELYLRWVNSEIRVGHFQAAADALARALDTFPDDPRLDQLTAYLGYRWTKGAEAGSAKDWNGLANIYARSMKQFPESTLLRENAAYFFQEWARAAYAKGGATAATPVLQEAVAKFPNLPKVHEAIANMANNAINERVKAGDFENAVAIVKQAGETLRAATTAQLRDNIPYLFQEWARAVLARGGGTAVLPVSRQAAAMFPESPAAREAVANVVIETINQKVSAGNFEGSIVTLKQAREIFPSSIAKQLFEYSYGNWGERYMKKKQWKEAIKIYELGLSELPQSELFRQNRTFCLEQTTK
jgi:tetratricopeptide (TPR) repeat protein